MSRGASLLHVVCAGALAWSCSAEAVRSDDAETASRADALARSGVFLTPLNPKLLDVEPELGDLSCRFLVTDVTGTTPKFDCELPSGERIKVKYGTTPEISGEIAASRLLTVLGFGADRVVLASRVRCYGCPASPFHTRRLAAWLNLDGLLRRTRDYSSDREFAWAAVEYKLEGEGIEDSGRKGWAFHELSAIDAARGGAAPADVDALRLMAVFLAHWDNKPQNQRLICLDPGERNDGDSCRRPLVMLQDVGATFGPRKVNLDGWRQTPIWSDRERCRLSMEHLPYTGGTFEEVEIFEGGRRLLADRLRGLAAPQIEQLFVGARFPGDPQPWVAAFQDKVTQIADGPACPSSPRSKTDVTGTSPSAPAAR